LQRNGLLGAFDVARLALDQNEQDGEVKSGRPIVNEQSAVVRDKPNFDV
jgi:hypothetical protein